MRRYAVEGLGTFAVMFTGSGAILVGGERLGDAGVALAFGLALAVMMFATQPLSAAHVWMAPRAAPTPQAFGFNPAIVFAAFVAGRISGREAVGYASGQLAGGVAGSALALGIANGRPGGAPLAARALANGYEQLSPGFYGLGSAFLAEATLTGLFVFVVLGASRSPLLPAIAGLAYGLVHLVGRPVTGLAANPARALGPALFAGAPALEQLWLFFAAPLAGALAATLAFRALSPEPVDARAPLPRA
jgi:aquaporin Z